MDDRTSLTLAEAYKLAFGALAASGFSQEHAEAIARNIVRCQWDECDSHGLYRVLVCARTMRAGAASPDAVPSLVQSSSNIVRLDAGGAYSLVAFEKGLPLLVDSARRHGLAALVINNCYHFSALWPEVEDIAAHGLAALALVPSFSFVAPAGGKEPALGTNPLAFAWPRCAGLPYVFDFATSATARGEIELHRKAGQPIPEGWAIDKDGHSTTDPLAALEGSMLTFGGYKGSALSTMIELLAGVLIGDLISIEARELDGGLDGSPKHGELIIAFDPEHFTMGDLASANSRAERLFSAITDQGARLPSERRYAARRRNDASGTISIPRGLYEDILALHDDAVAYGDQARIMEGFQ